MSSPAPFPLRRWAAVRLPGVVLYFAPLPALTPDQRHLLAFFTAMIISFMARPVPMGVSVLGRMTLIALTETLPPVRRVEAQCARRLILVGETATWAI